MVNTIVALGIALIFIQPDLRTNLIETHSVENVSGHHTRNWSLNENLESVIENSFDSPLENDQFSNSSRCISSDKEPDRNLFI